MNKEEMIDGMPVEEFRLKSLALKKEVQELGLKLRQLTGIIKRKKENNQFRVEFHDKCYRNLVDSGFDDESLVFDLGMSIFYMMEKIKELHCE